MEFLFTDRLPGFLVSCAGGFLTGAVYDLLRILQLFLKSRKRQRFFFDLFFMIVAAGIFFCVTLAANRGMFRLYLFLGTSMGMCGYLLTFGELTRILTGILMRLGAEVKKRIYKPIKERFCQFREKLRKKPPEKQKKDRKFLLKRKNSLKTSG